MLGAGVPLFVVSAHLGHENVSVTSKVYGHLIPGAGQAAADAMAKLLPATKKDVTTPSK